MHFRDGSLVSGLKSNCLAGLTKTAEPHALNPARVERSR
jgi:hypothetical protein